MSDRLLVSTRKGLFVLHRNSDGWQIQAPHFLGDNVTLALVDSRDGAWYAALNLGHFGVKLQRSDNAGESWQEIAVPTYGALDTIETGDGKAAKPAALQLIWSLECGVMHEPGRLWAGTIPGGLFYSDDRGDSWHLVRALWDRPERRKWMGGGYDAPGIHSICVDPRDAKVLRIAVSCGGVWTTRDAGASWCNTSLGMYADYMPPDGRFDPDIQDPHRMVQCADAPDTLWVQHHNGVFCSINGGTTWTDVVNIMPSKFGFAVAVHPRNANTAWFVPAIKDERRVPVNAQWVVARTSDCGDTFEVLRNGLPQIHAYDLVYRHGLTVDLGGNCLAMGSTTGSLWLSEDQGDSWFNLSTSFPPIHALRFG